MCVCVCVSRQERESLHMSVPIIHSMLSLATTCSPKVAFFSLFDAIISCKGSA